MPRILLTEDLPDQRALYRDTLIDAGYEVLEAPGAKEALDLLAKKPDVVVLDIQMPGMDGVDALGRIAARCATMPVILYSAYPSFKANFMTWRADAFVEKTGDPHELVDAIARILRARGMSVPEPCPAPSCTAASD